MRSERLWNRGTRLAVELRDPFTAHGVLEHFGFALEKRESAGSRARCAVPRSTLGVLRAETLDM